MFLGLVFVAARFGLCIVVTFLEFAVLFLDT